MEYPIPNPSGNKTATTTKQIYCTHNVTPSILYLLNM